MTGTECLPPPPHDGHRRDVNTPAFRAAIETHLAALKLMTANSPQAPPTTAHGSRTSAPVFFVAPQAPAMTELNVVTVVTDSLHVIVLLYSLHSRPTYSYPHHCTVGWSENHFF